MAVKVFWIDGPWPGRLGVVPRPRGGEWLEAETRAWRAAGIDVVVSLLEAAEAADLALGGESASALASGLEFLSFPVPDRDVPRSREAVARLTDQIGAALHSDKNVVIHCRQGLGRSPVIAAAVLVAAGYDPETAIIAVTRARGVEVPETPAQRQWIADFSSWLGGSSTRASGSAPDGRSRRSTEGV
jgi:protein-tyrosine phosphatase